MTVPSSRFPRPPATVRSVVVAGTGSFTPERVVTNRDLEKSVATSDEWIVTRTGIRERRIAGPETAASDLGAEAGRRALADAGCKPEDVDLIIVATISPDMGFPNTGCFVQQKIGAKRAACFDLEAACSGFIYALETGRSFVAAGAAETILVIGAEKLSAITDWQDRATCVLFGDGAGAAVLKAAPPGRTGVVATVMHSDGALADLLKLPAGGSRFPASHETVDQRMHFLKMEGKEVFRHAVTCMTAVAREALAKAGVGVDDLALIIPHQANMRIVDAIGSRLGGRPDQYFINLDRYGNTSAASVIIALDEAAKAGRLKDGDLVLLVAFGGGFTWAASVVEWTK
jgi:3-oxoacyl-[acyl-carrier-protein] synthase III